MEVHQNTNVKVRIPTENGHFTIITRIGLYNNVYKHSCIELGKNEQ